MITIALLLLVLTAGVESIICPTGQQACGSSGCYDPTIQGCLNGGSTIQCINSCNGTCYSNSQYCYNNTKVCNNGESICNVKTNSYFGSYPLGLNCYNSSQFTCSNNTLCSSQYSCGTQCLMDYNSVCVNNRTLCSGFYYWNYYWNYNVNLCGPQQTCYDNTTSVCLNGTTVCQGLNARMCASNCFNPDTQICVNGTVRCINSCNGTCYSNSQYCYNNTKVCNNGESICNVKNNGYFQSFPLGPNCYNSSQLICSNNTLCSSPYSCGTQCLMDYNASCANNRTLCPGFYFYDYYYTNRYVNVCGSQQTCYDNTTSVCLNGTVRCINSCNGTCYSNSQYCYNNTKVCNNGESVCDVKTTSYYFQSFPLGLNCYSSSQYVCSNNTLCYSGYSCGTQCLMDYNSVCVNNRTLCSGFYFWDYYYTNRYVNLCGPQQTCYDNTTSVCLGNNGTVCPFGNQLCYGVCYNPQSQYCTGGNNTIYCISNPSSSNCPTTTSTMRTSSTSISTTSSTLSMTATSVNATITTTTATPGSSSCCAVQSCTKNSDCCWSGSVECQCYRHNQTDLYGACINPNVTPICGDSCPVQVKCRYDSDCCKCQCADITFTDSDGQLTTKKQCAQR